MLKQLRTVAAVAMLTVTTYAVAVEMNGTHPDTYVVRKGDTETLQRLNKAIAAVKADGSLAAVIKKWGI